jgi:hypothetical protein
MRGRTLVYYVSAWTRCPTDWGKFTLSDEESQYWLLQFLLPSPMLHWIRE